MKEDHENIKIDVYQATEADSHIIFDLWKGSARWIQSKGINQWNPDHFNINQVYECFNNGFEFYLAQLNEEVVGTLYICWSDPVLYSNGFLFFIKTIMGRNLRGKRASYERL